MEPLLLQSLSLVNYRNYSDVHLDLQARVHLFSGLNGSGKTNLLDAIYLLSFSKGFLATSDGQNIRSGEREFLVKGKFGKGHGQHEVFCAFQKGKKKVLKKNGKEYEKLADHIGAFPAVLVSPQDNELISGSAEGRRKFLDGILCQLSTSYLKSLLQYNKGIAQRNSILKSNASSMAGVLEAINAQILPHAEVLRTMRKDLVAKFLPLFQEQYALLSNQKEQVHLEYKPSGEELAVAWETNLQKDMHLGYTSIGPHRDELKFVMNDAPIRRFGSQGQQKCFLLALKVTQAQLMLEKLQVYPLLLLDDVFDKLDVNRVAQLMEKVVAPYPGQVFISHTDAHFVDGLIAHDQLKTWEVNNGQVL